ncbi:MAG TPA: hypothetical protein VG711_09355 [Phycisphaerales bacterium]|nr:hypothetical protein [Phycisphaerales bacterium]
MARNSNPTIEQLRVATLIGVNLCGDTEFVAAARIEDAVSAAILSGLPKPATDRQVEFGKALGLALSSDSVRVASAKIDDELYMRNVAAAKTLGLKAGDRVVKRETIEVDGNVHMIDREYVVSSIDPNSLRIWFRGGNGQGAWPTQLEKTEE